MKLIVRGFTRCESKGQEEDVDVVLVVADEGKKDLAKNADFRREMRILVCERMVEHSDHCRNCQGFLADLVVITTPPEPYPLEIQFFDKPQEIGEPKRKRGVGCDTSPLYLRFARLRPRMSRPRVISMRPNKTP